jgi:alkylated DNA repair dioxygenase AlkB
MRKFSQIPKIPGLYLLEDVISESEENIILNKPHTAAMATPYTSWDSSLSTKSKLSKDSSSASDWLQILWLKVMSDTNLAGIIKSSKMFDSATVNHYSTGDILSPHIDTVRKWGDWIIGLSLQSDTIMDFASKLLTPHKVTKFIKLSHSILIPRRSMYIMTEEARHVWTHEIKKIENDRISINFRPFNRHDDDSKPQQTTQAPVEHNKRVNKRSYEHMNEVAATNKEIRMKSFVRGEVFEKEREIVDLTYF